MRSAGSGQGLDERASLGETAAVVHVGTAGSIPDALTDASAFLFFVDDERTDHGQIWPGDREGSIGACTLSFPLPVEDRTQEGYL